jgi:hypothetical protein
MGSSTTGQPPPILYGSLVSSLNHLEDHNGNMGLFFLFPDVSIRWRGRFQLGVTLLRISRRVIRSPDSGQSPVSQIYISLCSPGQTLLASLSRGQHLHKCAQTHLRFSLITNTSQLVCAFSFFSRGPSQLPFCSGNSTNAGISSPRCSDVFPALVIHP